MANLPFQLARGTVYVVGGVLLAGGVVLLGVSAIWLWTIGRLPADDPAGFLRLPLGLGAFLGGGIAWSGFFFLKRARETSPDES